MVPPLVRVAIERAARLKAGQTSTPCHSHEATGALLQRHLHSICCNKTPRSHCTVLDPCLVNVLQAPAVCIQHTLLLVTSTATMSCPTSKASASWDQLVSGQGSSSLSCQVQQHDISTTVLSACKDTRGQLMPLCRCCTPYLPGSRDFLFWASVTALYCTLHTLSTSGTRRLNSSKQPQLPLAAVQLQKVSHKKPQRIRDS